MSIVFPKKTEIDKKNSEELHNLELRAIGATFDWKSGTWTQENQENKAKESKLQMDLRKEEMKQRLLMHMLTDKEVKLSRAKKEITDLLKNHSNYLELQGFPVKNILSDTQRD
jgi:hypothetical protein